MKINGLTPHQFQVAELVAAGRTDKEIRVALNLSKAALWFHLRGIAKAWNITGNVRVCIANRVHGVPEQAA